MAHRASMYLPAGPTENTGSGRPKSMIGIGQGGHMRAGSMVGLSTGQLNRTDSNRKPSQTRVGSQPVGTFAPKFINKLAADDRGRWDEERVDRIEGENDFSGRQYVWLPDSDRAFVKGWIVDEAEDGAVVELEDGTRVAVDPAGLDRVNPAKFDKADDMAELTYLNEGSVIHNLRLRYQADLIYTYSGLFLVTVNPYRNVPIYGRDYVDMYRGRPREEARPHIFAVADEAFRNLVAEGQHQSILVTGESGAGKTENTKKVIQYLAAVASSSAAAAGGGATLSQQILQANPILEAFGNAQTVRNHNSSRFGKFIRIEFNRGGQIAGASIDWYLLEKSRVVKVTAGERNYHVFYQLLRGADPAIRRAALLDDAGIADFEYTRHGNSTIAGVSDVDEWRALIEALSIVGFGPEEVRDIVLTVAAVLHLGNVGVSSRTDQAYLTDAATGQLDRACRLLGVDVEDVSRALLRPRVKAGRETVEKAQTGDQVRLAIDALAKGVYERLFGHLVDNINRALDQRTGGGTGDGDSCFIGVLDIAGFEIFDHNSFEQLCINYTNEKLQQFFNHHMFVLEQDEYAREQIEWQFIDFGRDLQPTIDLIELSQPIGIFSCLDEESVMPKATDNTFTDKLHALWDRRAGQYRRSMLTQGFVLTHYAAEVEYSTIGWLEKNKDPVSENVTSLLARSRSSHVAGLFADCAPTDSDTVRTRVKRGLFRTVAQRHKEQLSVLMGQLGLTHPHFVRCILPNSQKRARQFDGRLVLDQLRCNGVLEGIRIARTGFPNRLPFSDFCARYGVLATADRDRDRTRPGSLDPPDAARAILDCARLDKTLFRVGLTKVFFRAGVLAELEERRDQLISEIVARFQCVSRGFTARRAVQKRLFRAEAGRMIQRSFRTYSALETSGWWTLFVRMKPLLGASRQANELRRRDDAIRALESRLSSEAEERNRVEADRRRADAEAARVQQTLEAERALALDKDAIFARLQAREAELKDRMAGLLAELGEVEKSAARAEKATRTADERAETVRAELQRAEIAVERLEAEKAVLEDQLGEMAEQLAAATANAERAHAKASAAEAAVARAEGIAAARDRQAAELDALLAAAEQARSEEAADAEKAASRAETAAKEASRTAAAETERLRAQLAALAATSDSYEDLIRQRQSELAVALAAASSADKARKEAEEDIEATAAQLGAAQAQLRDALARAAAAERRAVSAEDAAAAAAADAAREADAADQVCALERRLAAVQDEMADAAEELARERQSRDDVQMLAEHTLSAVKRDLGAVTAAKVTIEKEMYTQQDILRRAVAARKAAEQDRVELRAELRALRDQHLAVQAAKVELETDVDRAATAAAAEAAVRAAGALRTELAARDEQLATMLAEKKKADEAVMRLRQAVAELSSDEARKEADRERDRLGRELQLVRGRLAASEHDNRVLLNRVQAQRLEVARLGGRKEDADRARTDLDDARAEISRLEADLAASRRELAAAAASPVEDESRLIVRPRPDTQLARLDQAEIAVLKAARAEQFARSQARDADASAAAALAERARFETVADEAADRARRADARAEELGADLEAALAANRRLQGQLDDYRSQHALEQDDGLVSREQTRRKYLAELEATTAALHDEREAVVQVREENARLQAENSDIRAKWDSEAVNSAAWAKEKSRLELAVAELKTGRDDAAAAATDGQNQIVALLGQVRALRAELDGAADDRAELVREKTSVAAQLADAHGRLDALARGADSPAVRTAAAADQTIMQLRAKLAAQDDIVAAAVGKMKRAEAAATDAGRESAAARDSNLALHRDKATVEQRLRDAQLRVVDLETRVMTDGGADLRFLRARVDQLEQQLDSARSDSAASAKEGRLVERTVRDLQTQVARREQQRAALADEAIRARDRIAKLVATVDELQASESASRLAARRAERELRQLRHPSEPVEPWTATEPAEPDSKGFI